eukprot:GHVU01208988.1.p1 GENE.GHVU01208988.1~~GHVU01208988.1.p1  ORF type:complete len:218 (+),score=19.64 GHVU01208988.1:1942-2595(+)
MDEEVIESVVVTRAPHFTRSIPHVPIPFGFPLWLMSSLAAEEELARKLAKAASVTALLPEEASAGASVRPSLEHPGVTAAPPPGKAAPKVPPSSRDSAKAPPLRLPEERPALPRPADIGSGEPKPEVKSEKPKPQARVPGAPNKSTGDASSKAAVSPPATSRPAKAATPSSAPQRGRASAGTTRDDKTSTPTDAPALSPPTDSAGTSKPGNGSVACV